MESMKLYYLLTALSVIKGLEECGNSELYSITVQWQCGTGEHQINCSSLNDAFNYITFQQICSGQRLTASIYLNSLNVTLSNSTQIEGAHVAQLRLLGSNIHTIVACENGAVLKFKGATHAPISIEIKNVAFKRCGNGTAALALSGNCDITFTNLNVSNSSGSGLLLENISGKVNVSYSSFENNHLQSARFGAGVCINSSSTKSSTIISFMHCNFASNEVQGIPKPVSDLDLGGGGMSIAIGGISQDTVISITDCKFMQNHAQRGAGLFASFSGNASNNRIMIVKTEFQGNIYKHITKEHDIVDDLWNSGGGAMVVTTDASYSNTVLFKNCNFLENQATWGGALQLFSSPSKPFSQESVNNFTVISCTFIKNRGIIGSAISIHCQSASTAPESCHTKPLIAGESYFHSNGQNMTEDFPHFSFNGQTREPTSSILNMNSFPTYIRGTVSFNGNTGSPLYVYETAVIIGKESLLKFENNTAQNGGGVTLYDSWMAVSSGSRLHFKNNKAYIYGGAIYAHQSKQLYVPYAHNCFIRYSSSNTETSPWEWNSTFEFSGNIARNKSNSIYATSVIPCMWRHSDNMSLSDDIRATFCHWAKWTFHDQNCIDQILTSIRNFSSTSDSVQLSPGIRRQFIVGVDDLGHNLTELPVIPSLYPPVQGYTVNYTIDGIAIYGPTEKNLTILIQIDGDRTVFKTVNMTITRCPPGFVFSSNLSSCRCVTNQSTILLCDDLKWTAILMNGYCMSYNSRNGVVYGRCVFTALQRSHIKLSHIPYILLPNDEGKLKKEFCGKFNRTGQLCGKCIKGLSIDVFSDTFECHLCSSSRAKNSNWIIFFIVNGLPPLVMFIAILLLHISLTGGPTNGFIFFSQVLTLSQQVIMITSVIKATNILRSSVLTDFIVDSYSIWSLDFYRIYHTFTEHRYPLCLSEKLRVIDVLALQYFSALYPFLLIVMAYLVIELHARNCRILVCLWRPLCLVCTRFRLSLRAQTSVVDALAAFFILSYVKIVRISLLLVTYSTIRELKDDKVIKRVSNYDPTIVFMSQEHMPYLIMGTFFLLTFGLLPPLLLLSYQFRMVQRCLDRCKMNRLGLKTFMDAFQGCYKDGRCGGPDRRFFAGLYLTFRIVMFLIFNLETSHINVYLYLSAASIVIVMLIAFLRPYKIKFYNALDIFFACLLTFYFGLHIKGFSYVETMRNVPKATILVANFLSIIPLIYLIGFVIIKAVCRYCHLQRLGYKVWHVMCNICQKRHVQYRCTPLDGDIHPNQLATHSEITVASNSNQLVNPFLYNSPSTSQAACCKENIESRYGSVN